MLLSESSLSELQRSPRLSSESEFIIEYHISQVSLIELTADSDDLKISLRTAPKFYIRDLMDRTNVLHEQEDFTFREMFSRSFTHSIQRPASVDPEEFRRLKDWLDNQLIRINQAIPPEQNLAQRLTMLRPVEMTQSDDDIKKWLRSVDPDIGSAETLEHAPLSDDEDNILMASEGLWWRSDQEYFAALGSAKQQRRPRLDLDPGYDNIIGRLKEAESLEEQLTVEQDRMNPHIKSQTDTLSSITDTLPKHIITQQRIATSPEGSSRRDHWLVRGAQQLVDRLEPSLDTDFKGPVGRRKETESLGLQVTGDINPEESRQILEPDLKHRHIECQPGALNAATDTLPRIRISQQGTATPPKGSSRRSHWLVRGAQELVDKFGLDKL